MPKKIDILILEDFSTLESLLRKTSTDLLRSRIKALILLKKGNISYQSELSKKLGYTEKTVREWLKLYKSTGLEGLLSLKSGGNGKSTISEKARVLISEKLNSPSTTITSYSELQFILEKEHQIQINYKTLYGYCRRHHQSKLKVARKSHYKKDEQAVEAFLKIPRSARTH